MITSFVVATSQGSIIQTGTGPDELIPLYATGGLQSIEGYANADMHYIKDSQITNKPENTTTIDKTELLANGLDKIVLSSSPSGAVVTIDGLSPISITSDGTDIDLIFDIAGTYKLTCILFPYLDFEAEINAT